MALHDYRCDRCRGIVTTTANTGDTHGGCPDPSCGGVLRKKYSFNTVAVAPQTRFQPHKNIATGQYTNSMAEHRANLARLSEEATRRTGIEHNYVSIDPRDKDACGVTGEGKELLARNKSLAGQRREDGTTLLDLDVRPVEEAAAEEGRWLDGTEDRLTGTEKAEGV